MSHYCFMKINLLKSIDLFLKTPRLSLFCLRRFAFQTIDNYSQFKGNPNVNRYYVTIQSSSSPSCIQFSKCKSTENNHFSKDHYLSNLVIVNLRKYTDSVDKKTMVQVLNVAEKNDASKNLAEILSRGGYRRREGFSKFNKIYEFEMILQGERCHMIMTSVSGHLLNQSFTGNYKKWYACNPVELFDAPVVKVCGPQMEPVKRTLEKEARNASRLVIWTDCDREGENIGFEIISVCKAINQNLQVYRAKFSEITFQSVNRAIQNLGLPDEKQNNAVEVRSELDLRIGAAFTRFQTLRLQKVFPQILAQTLISYGSCQFPTLGFVVERYKAIEDFIPEEFWKLKVSHEWENCVVEFHWRRVRLFDQLACQVLHDKCLENPRATVRNVNSKMKSKWRPQPLDTIELEKLSSRKLRLNAKETMRIAEKLYTSGYISYPRTETNIFPKELELRPLVQMQVENPNWGGFASRVLENGPTPRQGKKTDQAHPPIHPTKYARNLEGNEQRLYEFIVRHFLACCDKDAKGTETVVEIEISKEEFLASGLIILERNYLDVYPYDKWSDKEMPNYEQGQVFEPTSIDMFDGQTSPPSLLTEADLIALMEKHGIGTDATHADHIETIKSRLYVCLHDTRFVPGELGMGLVEGYDAMGFQMSKPTLRAELEADLKRICEGTRDPEIVLREQVTKYKNVFREAMRQASKIDEALSRFLNEAPQAPAQEVAIPDIPQISSAVMKCPACGADIVVRPKRDNKGFFFSCQGYPDCKVVMWLPETVINVQMLDEKCPQCRGNPRKLKFTFSPRAYTPILPTEYTTCIGGCDALFMETLDIQSILNRHSQRRESQASNQSTTHDSGYASNNSFTPTSSSQTRIVLTNRTNSNTPIGRSNLGDWSNRQSDSVSRCENQQPNTSFNPTNQSFNNPFVRNQTNGARNNWGNTSEEGNAIVCNCNEDAIKLTVKKEGPNTGRQFYKCGKPQGQGCNFFLWADDGNKEVTTSTDNSNWNTSSASWNTASSNFGRGNGNLSFTTTTENDFSSPSSSHAWDQENDFDNAESVACNCGIDAKRLTTMKEGANKGREFYVCSKTRDEQCGYFQWVDEMGSGGSDNQRRGSTSSWRGSNTRGRGSVARQRGGLKRKAPGGDGPHKRKCGVCGEGGHNRKNCPHL